MMESMTNSFAGFREPLMVHESNAILSILVIGYHSSDHMSPLPLACMLTRWVKNTAKIGSIAKLHMQPVTFSLTPLQATAQVILRTALPMV